MADEQPVPETLESIAASIRELRTSIDARFTGVDAKFVGIDARFDEVKAQLRTEIESVRGDVRLVAEGLAAQTILLQRMDKNHQRLEERVDTHDVRILALEPKKSA